MTGCALLQPPGSAAHAEHAAKDVHVLPLLHACSCTKLFLLAKAGTTRLSLLLPAAPVSATEKTAAATKMPQSSCVLR
jgi:hypothetical protein